MVIYMQELVSIISPCYNGEHYLERFFNSVLHQSYKKLELIFVNDGSTDKTEEIALFYKEKFQKEGMDFIYLYQDHTGQAAAMNKGLAAYNGEYIAWVDSDDILYPVNIQRKLEFLQNNQEYGFVLCEAEVVNEKDINKQEYVWKRKIPNGNDLLFLDYIYGRNVVFGPGTILVRSSALEKALPEKRIFESPEGQNWQIMLPLSYTSRCGYIEEVLVKIVSHPDSHSRRKRSCAEELQREEAFIELCNRTIRNIPGISDTEIALYCNLVENIHLNNQLKIACTRGAPIKAHFFRKALGERNGTDFVFDYVITSFIRRCFLFLKRSVDHLLRNERVC